MSSDLYKLVCSIAPPSVVYISDEPTGNEFTIEFTKELITSNEHFKTVTDNDVTANLSGMAPKITVMLEIGDGVNDICTKNQTKSLRFTTLHGEPWKSEINSDYKTITFTAPRDFDISKFNSVAFKSSGFYTSAKEGMTTLKSYPTNFPGFKTIFSSDNLFKRFPIDIKYFKASKYEVELGDKTSLSWEVNGATSCTLTTLGEVNRTGTKNVSIKAPATFTLKAENSMGMSKEKSLDISCTKPTIELSCDSQYYHKEGSVILTWKSTSAYSVRIDPDVGEVPNSGSRKIFPRANIYTAIASGYDCKNPIHVSKSVKIIETPWTRLEQVTGINLLDESNNVDKRILTYNNEFYIFYGDTIYKSVDAVTWQSVSKLEIELDMQINKTSTAVVNGKFIVMGITRKKSEFIYYGSYDLVTGKWDDIAEAMPGLANLGGELVTIGDTPYYGKLIDTMVMFQRPKSTTGGWETILYFKDTDMDGYDLSVHKDSLFIAAHEKTTKKLKINSTKIGDTEWVNDGTTVNQVTSWFSMIQTDGAIYLLSGNSMINLSNYKEVSEYHPPFDKSNRPWTGSMGNNVYVISTDGYLWCLEE